MAKNTIEQVNNLFVLKTDDLTYSTHTTRAEAEKELEKLNRADRLHTAAEEGVEELIDELCRRFSWVDIGDARKAIKEAL